jgi:hypothetical protein
MCLDAMDAFRRHVGFGRWRRDKSVSSIGTLSASARFGCPKTIGAVRGAVGVSALPRAPASTGQRAHRLNHFRTKQNPPGRARDQSVLRPWRTSHRPNGHRASIWKNDHRKQINGLQFRATVSPDVDAPAFDQHVQFVANPALPSPVSLQGLDNRLPLNQTIGAWSLTQNAFARPLRDDTLLGCIVQGACTPRLAKATLFGSATWMARRFAHPI